MELATSVAAGLVTLLFGSSALAEDEATESVVVAAGHGCDSDALEDTVALTKALEGATSLFIRGAFARSLGGESAFTRPSGISTFTGKSSLPTVGVISVLVTSKSQSVAS